MTYPSDFTDPQSVFGDLADLAIYPVTSIEQQVDLSWRFHVTFSPAGPPPDVAVGTPLVYSYPTANGDYEIVTVVSCNRAGGYIAVTRQAEGTAQLAYGPGGYLVQEPTAATYTALKNLLLLTEKYAGRMGTILPGTCSPGMFFFKTDAGAFYACFAPNIWTRLDLVDHGALTGLDLADAHSIYYTLAQAMAWHAALPKLHLSNASGHDHSEDSGTTGLSVRRFRAGTFANRPAVQHAGDLYLALDTKQLSVSRDGATWEIYSTVPTGTIMLFLSACPAGWDRVIDFNSKFPRGAAGGVWTGFGSGGTSNAHHHTMATLIKHNHVISAYGYSTAANSNHTHNISIWSGGGSDTVPFSPDDAFDTTNLNSSSDGAHQHSVTFPSATTTSAGVASPVTGDLDGSPSYHTLLFCRKQ